MRTFLCPNLDVSFCSKLESEIQKDSIKGLNDGQESLKIATHSLPNVACYFGKAKNFKNNITTFDFEEKKKIKGE